MDDEESGARAMVGMARVARETDGGGRGGIRRGTTREGARTTPTNHEDEEEEEEKEATRGVKKTTKARGEAFVGGDQGEGEVSGIERRGGEARVLFGG